jgi:hypothetical protein
MGRLRRFAEHRFIGRRDEMLVYDCDDPNQFALLERAVLDLRLDLVNGLSSFAPDTAAEARNRGFKPGVSLTADTESQS